ncbi:peptidase M24, structural domain-containing protein [Lactifluus subvellereus]|nr:peptidase M24, structural domain-containing protein [Lactifluus subvellereus]
MGPCFDVAVSEVVSALPCRTPPTVLLRPGFLQYLHYGGTAVVPASVYDCVVTSGFEHLSSHCPHIFPIPESSFLCRQQPLANALRALNASAYIAEPGASAAYFVNISGSSWHLSDRPLLLMVTPGEENSSTVEATARIPVLTPAFEATLRGSFPCSPHPRMAGDVDPYEVAVVALPMPRGDADADAQMISVDGKIHRLRERKSREVLDVLKYFNEATVLAMRAIREKLHIGIRESQAWRLLQHALAAVGNAAHPHGSGTDRTLGPSDLVVTDCGGSLHGYMSGVTGTFYLDESKPTRYHVTLWNLVHEAQALAMNAAHAGTITSVADKVARDLSKRFGVAQFFTHHLGHGIGLEDHESPYLRGNSVDIIEIGHIFTNEPGIYIEGEINFRLSSKSQFSAVFPLRVGYVLRIAST